MSGKGEKMDKNKLYPIISIAAVIIFFIWGWIEGTFAHSWIIFLGVPLGMLIIKALGKGDMDEKK